MLRRWPAWRLASSKPIRVGFLDEKPSSYAAGCGVHVPQVFIIPLQRHHTGDDDGDDDPKHTPHTMCVRRSL